MQSKSQKLRYWSKNGVYAGLILLFVSMGMGCASTPRTTKTETTVTTSTEPQQNKGMIYVNKETTTTTTTAETKPVEHPGVISSTLHAIGYVISIPFIIIGGVFRTIFGG